MSVLLAVWAGVLLALPARALAQPDEPLRADGELDGQPLGPTLALLEDRHGSYTLEDVRAPGLAARFQPSADDAPSLGFTKSTYWVRFEVENASNAAAHWLLELAYPLLDDVTLYVPRDDGRYEVSATGDHRPFSSRPIAHRTFVFPLDEPARTRRVYYLRIATESSMSLPLKAWDAASFVAHLPRDLGITFLFYGIALAMAAYHICAYAFIRKGDLLFYVLQVFVTGFMQFTLSGHAFQFLVPDRPDLAEMLLRWSLALMLASACFVSAAYMDIARSHPLLDRVVRWCGVASLSLGVVAEFLPYRTAILTFVSAAAVVIVFGIAMCIWLAIQQIHRAKLYLLAWMSTVIGVLVFALKTYGFLPTNLATIWSYHIGSAIQLVLLSSALVDWANSMRSDLGHLNRTLSQKVDALSAALMQAEDATTRAEEATRTKAEFVATMSHELRTPLNAIINVPQGLLKDFPRALAVVCGSCGSMFELERGERVTPETACPECTAATLKPGSFVKYNGKPEQTAHYLALIERSGKHLLQMVNSILDSSKIDAGRLVLAVERFEVAGLLAEVVDEMSDAAQRAGVSIAIECAANIEPMRADPLRIKQVLLNLLSNAIKFSEGRGPIVVAASPATSGCVVSVKDRGIGIAREDFDRIFANFEQVHKGNTRKYGGTGLGLSISRTLVRMHGGELWVESELGQGTTFFFSIPGVIPSEISMPTVQASEPPQRPLVPSAAARS